jgi:hypothetical protein
MPLSGLQVAAGQNGGSNYVTNASGSSFVCSGDVVVRGMLFLKNVNLKTDNKGCRLYVSGSVFIQGAVTYASVSGVTTPNLQITSSRMIGMGFSPSSLSNRLALSGDRAWTLPAFHLRSASDVTSLHRSFVTEASSISGMVDADSDTTDQVQFTGVLLNAPEVHSRYIGNFNGAVVAELALFRLNQFVFTFDSIFQDVPIFPALEDDILSLTD